MQKLKSIIIYIFKKIKLIIATIISFLIFIFINDHKKESQGMNKKKTIQPSPKPQEPKETTETVYHDNSVLNLNPKKSPFTLKDLLLEILNIKERDLTEIHKELLLNLDKKVPKETFNEDYKKALDIVEDEIIKLIIEEPIYLPIIHQDCSDSFLKKIEDQNLKTQNISTPTLETQHTISKEPILNQSPITKSSEKNLREQPKPNTIPEAIPDTLNITPPLISLTPIKDQLKPNTPPELSKSETFTPQPLNIPSTSIPEQTINPQPLNSPPKIYATEDLEPIPPELINHLLEETIPPLNLEATITQDNIPQDKTTKKEEQPNNNQNQPKEETPQENIEIKKELDQPQINYASYTTLIASIEKVLQTERQKENLEDKNYASLELEINILLAKINNLKSKNLPKEQELLLSNLEQKAKTLETTIQKSKEQDIIKEETLLNETITLDQINSLELEINKLYQEFTKTLNNNLLTKIEDLRALDQRKAKTIEKKLLIDSLKKTSKLPFILKLPFIKNRYFSYLSYNLFVNNNFKLYNSIINTTTVNYTPSNIDHIKKGYKALNSSIHLVNENLEYLNYLEQVTLKKHPELLYDPEFQAYLNQTRTNLLNNQEKLLAKKQLVRKYNLNNKHKVLKRIKTNY